VIRRDTGGSQPGPEPTATEWLARDLEITLSPASFGDPGSPGAGWSGINVAFPHPFVALHWGSAMWRHARLLLLLCLGVASSVCTRGARADSAPKLRVSLEYEAEEALHCPTESEFIETVTNRLGYSVFVPPGAGQRLRIEISRERERTHASIEWFDREQNSEGERRLRSDSPTCEELARNLAFAVAVQIQLHASALEPPKPEPESEPRPDRPPAAPPKPNSAPKAVVPPLASGWERRPVSRGGEPSWFFGAGVLARSGLSPELALGGRAFGAFATGLALIELSVHATAPSSLTQSDGSGFNAYEVGASLAPCLRLRALAVCGVGTASQLRVQGEGVDRTRSPSSLLAAAGGRVQLLLPVLSRLGVLAGGEVVGILTPRTVLLNESKVWSTAPVAVTVSLNFAGIFE
jgi:hypothetical protein